MNKSRYRALLIKRGVPEVYAHMASENLCDDNLLHHEHYTKHLLLGGFDWAKSHEGIDFWQVIYSNIFADNL